MKGIHSDKRLHLQYRLWIAAMNGDISALRIFDDYFKEISLHDTDAGIKKKLEDFKLQLADIRHEIDELKHEMHLDKMKLAANLRVNNMEHDNDDAAENYTVLKKRFTAFCQKFDALKKEIVSVA